jgi:hypothetical protein
MDTEAKYDHIHLKKVLITLTKPQQQFGLGERKMNKKAAPQ